MRGNQNLDNNIALTDDASLAEEAGKRLEELLDEIDVKEIHKNEKMKSEVLSKLDGFDNSLKGEITDEALEKAGYLDLLRQMYEKLGDTQKAVRVYMRQDIISKRAEEEKGSVKAYQEELSSEVNDDRGNNAPPLAATLNVKTDIM